MLITPPVAVALFDLWTSAVLSGPCRVPCVASLRHLPMQGFPPCLGLTRAVLQAQRASDQSALS